MIDCHYRQPGRCLAGHFGGRPSDGVCTTCPHRVSRSLPAPEFPTCERCEGRHHVLACPIPPDHDPETERARRSCCDPPRP